MKKNRLSSAGKGSLFSFCNVRPFLAPGRRINTKRRKHEGKNNRHFGNNRSDSCSGDSGELGS